MTPSETRTCGNPKCRHCLVFDPYKGPRPRPLTPDDLRWEFGEAESALGIKSTLGAFVDMALSGIQGGGRINGVENRAVETWRLDAASKHRCVRARLAEVPLPAMAVLRAAYGPDDWTRSIGDPTIRKAVEGALSRAKVAPSACRVTPMTPTAMESAARRQEGRRAPERPERKPDRVRPKNETEAEHLSKTLRWYMFEQAGLHASPRGIVISAACDADKSRLWKMTREAEALLLAAREAAGIQELHVPRRSGVFTRLEGRRSHA